MEETSLYHHRLDPSGPDDDCLLIATSSTFYENSTIPNLLERYIPEYAQDGFLREEADFSERI